MLNKLSKRNAVLLYLAIWTIALIVFWFFTSASDAFGFSLLFLWILIPVTTFTISFLIGKKGAFGKENWLFPLFFGVMYMLAEYATFNAANMIYIRKINLPNFRLILVGGIISAIGLGIGTWINARKLKKI